MDLLSPMVISSHPNEEETKREKRGKGEGKNRRKNN